MKRSTSFVHGKSALLEFLPEAEERPQIDYNRFIYINTEQAHKQKHTIFHSPYKGGKKNPQYSNPSFMSSDVFYPKDYSFNQLSKSKSKPNLGLIPTKNDMIQQEQYRSRMMKKSHSGVCLNKGLKNEKSKKLLQNIGVNLQKSVEKGISPNRITQKILRKLEDNRQLRQQLELLRKSPPKTSHSGSIQNQNPIYLEGRNSILNKIMKKESSKRQLIDEMSKALRRKQEEKWQKENEKRQQKTLIDKEVLRFQHGIKRSNEFERQKARLLSELLLEQILQKS